MKLLVSSEMMFHQVVCIDYLYVYVWTLGVNSPLVYMVTARCTYTSLVLQYIRRHSVSVTVKLGIIILQKLLNCFRDIGELLYWWYLIFTYYILLESYLHAYECK